MVPAASTDEEIEAEALADERIKKFTEGKQIKRVIVVPKKLVNVGV